MAALVALFAPAIHVGHRMVQPSPPVPRAAVVLASADAARGSLLKVVHQVADPEAVASFYTRAFGLESVSADGDARTLLASGSASPQLELVHAEGATYGDGKGYRGISMRVPDVAAAVEAATAQGGSVLEETAEVRHGPSNVPLEEDGTVTPVVEALVADPCGFPVHLYQAEDVTSAALSGVRLDVYEWKKSSEWYASELGWKTLRFQSNVLREASLCVLLGGPGSEGAVGPVGALTAEQPAPLISLRYVYGSAVREGGSGLEAIVCSAGDGSPAELVDPDANTVLLV